jgi:pre-mRNA-splicing factor 18
MGEPAILFAETHAQRLRRYYILITPKPVLSTGPIPTTLALLPESAMKVPAKPPPPGPDRDYLYRQLASYFTLVLAEWAAALAARPAAVAETFQGKQAYSAMTQSRENMRALFRRFEKGSLEDGILEPVVEIVRAAQERRYVDANDGYLTLSIGKAAWPIGVTMVGIHERSAREKLHESDKGAAHIMSDEVTRKFLQSIKRCLSFAQTRWPPEDHLQLMG